MIYFNEIDENLSQENSPIASLKFIVPFHLLR